MKLRTTALLALGSFGCTKTPAPNPTPAPSSSTSIVMPGQTEPQTNDAQVFTDKLSPYVVTEDSIAQRTLYTWTTSEQVDALRKDRQLLTRTESPEHGASYFDQVLEKRATSNDALAKMLRTSAFAKARYAWPAAYATRLGMGDEQYGIELIQVVLKADSWFVVIRTSDSLIQVVDMNNQVVDPAAALQSPERIAAAYFMQDTPVTGYQASVAGADERTAYREYVLCNESMIESFSVRTSGIAAEVDREVELLKSLSKYAADHPAPRKPMQHWMVELAKQTWHEPAKEDSVITTYEATLAFADFPYVLDEGNLERLVKALRRTPLDGEPLTHKPTIAFSRAALQTPAAAPRVVPPKGPSNRTH